MKNRPISISAAVRLILATHICLSMYPAKSDTWLPGYPEKNDITLVKNDGKIEVRHLGADEYGVQKIWKGSYLPKISPDQKHVAFSRGQNIFIQETGSGTELQVTNEGKPYSAPYISVECLILAWSPSSSKLLYSVTPGDSDPDPDSEENITWEQRTANYGFFIFDLSTKKHEPLRNPDSFYFESWLTDDLFLLLDQEHPPFSSKFIVWSRSKNSMRTLIKGPKGLIGQVESSQNGQVAAYTFSEKSGESQIMKIDLATEQQTPVSDRGIFAEFQGPKLSRNGLFIAYNKATRQEHMVNFELRVNNQTGWPRGGIFEWVNDTTIAIEGLCGLEIVDIANKKLLAFYPEYINNKKYAILTREIFSLDCKTIKK